VLNATTLQSKIDPEQIFFFLPAPSRLWHCLGPDIQGPQAEQESIRRLKTICSLIVSVGSCVNGYTPNQASEGTSVVCHGKLHGRAAVGAQRDGHVKPPVSSRVFAEPSANYLLIPQASPMAPMTITFISSSHSSGCDFV